MSRYALVTGAAGDLGRAVCLGLARDGWPLLITDHPTQARGLDATREACAPSRVEIASLTFDVTAHDAVADAVGRFVARHGPPHAIVAMASMAGVNGAPNMPAYAASKAAVLGLAKSASRDLAPHGIRVNAVSPAFIGPGAMWDNQVARQAAAASQYYSSDPEEVARQMIELVPLRRYGAPSEVADVICYLVSDRASYLTGINVEVAGGAL